MKIDKILIELPPILKKNDHIDQLYMENYMYKEFIDDPEKQTLVILNDKSSIGPLRDYINNYNTFLMNKTFQNFYKMLLTELLIELDSIQTSVCKIVNTAKKLPIRSETYDDGNDYPGEAVFNKNCIIIV